MPTLPLDQLRVYRTAEDLADAAWSKVSRWNSFAKDTVGIQLVRAMDSVGANVAEGYGRGSFADNRRFVRIARGSLYETRFFVRRAEARGLLTAEASADLQAALNSYAPMLNAYLRSIGPTNGDEDQ